MARKHTINRCPECNRIGTDPSAGLNGLCKACVTKKTCVQCGEKATNYLEENQCWYCERHYKARLEPYVDMFRDNFITDFGFDTGPLATVLGDGDHKTYKDFPALKKDFGYMERK